MLRERLACRIPLNPLGLFRGFLFLSAAVPQGISILVVRSPPCDETSIKTAMYPVHPIEGFPLQD